MSDAPDGDSRTVASPPSVGPLLPARAVASSAAVPSSYPGVSAPDGDSRTVASPPSVGPLLPARAVASSTAVPSSHPSVSAPDGDSRTVASPPSVGPLLPARAVAFAYHEIGVRCLAVLLAQGMEVACVVTHADDPGEERWFASVAEFARDRDLPVRIVPNVNVPEFVAEIAALAPDFIFSFHFRQLLGAPLLALARRGALNMHSSLLPRYRGRAPINWVILNGERETGASLHYMTEKPDAGDLVDQEAVPILPEDTALDVYRKVACAAERVLHRSLPKLLTGTAPRIPLDLARGSYFGRRTPEDGRIDFGAPAKRIHDLVRAVAPPYPGAFFDLRGHRVRVLRSRLIPEDSPPASPRLHPQGERLVVEGLAGGRLLILAWEIDGRPASVADTLALFGPPPWPLSS